jgi:hypothetical protein
MSGFSDALFLLTETRTLVSRALIGFAVFLVVYKFLLPQLFRSWKVDTVLVMGILYLLLQISLRSGGVATGW